MPRFYLVFGLLLVPFVSMAQIDNPNANGSGIDIPFGSDIDSPIISNDSFSSKNFGLDNPDDKTGFGQFSVPDTISLGVTKEKGVQFNTDNGLMTRKMDSFTPKYFTKDKEVKEEYKRNQFLGSYPSEAEYIVIRCRDHEFVDGDRVKIYVNGKVMIPGILLEGSYREFELFLDPGSNTVEIEALNQGTSGPNTAEIIVIDDNGIIMFQNEWNLSTGTKARFMVIKPQE